MTSFPVTRVWLDGKQIKDVPLEISVPVGDHNLLLTNPEHDPPIKASRKFTITADKPLHIHYPWP